MKALDEPGTHDHSDIPGLIDMWDEEANAPVVISQIPRSNGVFQAHWKCPEGHAWQEGVRHRRVLHKWQENFPDAHRCRECVIEKHCPPCSVCGEKEMKGLYFYSEEGEPYRCADCSAGSWSSLEWLIRNARSKRARTWPKAPPHPPVGDDPVGSVLPGSTVTSLMEGRLAKLFDARGVPYRQFVSVVVPNLVHQAYGKTWKLTPDFLVDVGDGRLVAIEVDAPSSIGGGPSHQEGFPARDLFRDDCLRASGAVERIVRLRQHGLEPVPDAVNITCEGNATKDDLIAICGSIANL